MIDELIKELEILKSTNLPTHLQQEVDEFAENNVEPIVVEYLQSMGTAASLNDLVKTIHVNKLNTAIKKLATLKAYFEFIKKTATTGEQVLVYEEIIAGLGGSIQVLLDTYAKATQGIANTHAPATISFTPSSFDYIGSFELNWQGTIIKGNYIGYKEATTGSNPKPGTGTVIQVPPPTGNNKPGASTGSNPKPAIPKPGTGTVIQVPPPTGNNKPGASTGSNPKPANNIGGSGIKPGIVISANKPANNNFPSESKQSNNDKKYWILGGAVLLAAYLFNQK